MLSSSHLGTSKFMLTQRSSNYSSNQSLHLKAEPTKEVFTGQFRSEGTLGGPLVQPTAQSVRSDQLAQGSNNSGL